MLIIVRTAQQLDVFPFQPLELYLHHKKIAKTYSYSKRRDLPERGNSAAENSSKFTPDVTAMKIANLLELICDV